MEEINDNEILKALERSGYLLESQISKILRRQNFIVETNQIIEDPITGKSREIDLIAEFFSNRYPRNKCCAKIRFIFEIKNNTAPLVLLTEFEHSPNIEDWEGLKEYLTIPINLEYSAFESYYETLIEKNRGNIFTQYCSFQPKKGNGELMALHPENIYQGLQKITQFCEEEIGEREYREESDGYFRHFLNLPVLLISKDLYELKISENNIPTLRQVESSILVYNYHFKGQSKMAYVFVTTEKGFSAFIDKMLKLEEEVELKLIASR